MFRSLQHMCCKKSKNGDDSEEDIWSGDGPFVEEDVRLLKVELNELKKSIKTQMSPPRHPPKRVPSVDMAVSNSKYGIGSKF